MYCGISLTKQGDEEDICTSEGELTGGWRKLLKEKVHDLYSKINKRKADEMGWIYGRIGGET
jgi:hypothetical protein